jgi:hypothetical protein
MTEDPLALPHHPRLARARRIFNNATDILVMGLALIILTRNGYVLRAETKPGARPRSQRGLETRHSNQSGGTPLSQPKQATKLVTQ